MLYLRTFGGLSVETDGAPATGAARQRKTLAVLALLAAAGRRGMSRDKLLAYLWPDSDVHHGHLSPGSRVARTLRKQIRSIALPSRILFVKRSLAGGVL